MQLLYIASIVQVFLEGSLLHKYRKDKQGVLGHVQIQSIFSVGEQSVQQHQSTHRVLSETQMMKERMQCIFGERAGKFPTFKPVYT